MMHSDKITQNGGQHGYFALFTKATKLRCQDWFFNERIPQRASPAWNVGGGPLGHPHVCAGLAADIDLAPRDR